MTFKKVMKTFFTELVWYTRLLGAVLVVACTTPGPVIARPDPNTSTSGTLGSVKATDGARPLTGNGIPDSARRQHDSVHQ
jgi:hypothetical protein